MTRIYNYLDEPRRILLWSIDEVMFIIATTFTGALFLNIIFMLLISIFLSFAVYRPLIDKIGRKRLRGYFYWHFPSLFTNKGNFPASHKRKLIG